MKVKVKKAKNLFYKKEENMKKQIKKSAKKEISLRIVNNWLNNSWQIITKFWCSFRMKTIMPIGIKNRKKQPYYDDLGYLEKGELNSYVVSH